MKKIILLTIVLSVMVFAFIGCDIIKKSDNEGTDKHVHSGGVADCSSSPVCDECGESYGAPLDHSYIGDLYRAQDMCLVWGGRRRCLGA